MTQALKGLRYEYIVEARAATTTSTVVLVARRRGVDAVERRP